VDEASLLDEHGQPRGAVQYTQFARAIRDRLLSIMRPDLERVLRENLPSAVDFRFGATVTAVEDHGDGVRVGLDGRSDDADRCAHSRAGCLSRAGLGRAHRARPLPAVDRDLLRPGGADRAAPLGQGTRGAGPHASGSLSPLT